MSFTDRKVTSELFNLVCGKSGFILNEVSRVQGNVGARHGGGLEGGRDVVRARYGAILRI
jgi:hypothetical protein